MSLASSPEDNVAGASSSSTNESISGTTYAAAGDAAVNLNPLEKTISCVSCRKRKLKCDRVKPRCATCKRLRHECEYPERRRNITSKRRNMKELEERLAQVETKLVAETSKNSLSNNSPNKEPEWNSFPLDMDTNINMSMNMDYGNDAYMDLPNPADDLAFQVNQVFANVQYSQEMVGLGLDEALPPDEMIDELHQVYFDKIHPQAPMIHKQRYLASLNLPPHMQPPISLRYMIWAMAATLVDEYAQYDDVFYRRARKYLEQAEMKGYGETFVTVPIAQAWALISTYEAKKTFFTRAWMSSGRLTRLCLMLSLHLLDGKTTAIKQILPPPKDWIELEERRRTFWSAFYCDRWASSGTGWPMIIDENLIMTNLPSSEEAYSSGLMETSISLEEALKPSGAAGITPFGGVILSACLFGHNFEHLHKRGPNEHPEDLLNGEFWKRHRKMDNILSNTFMFLPAHLRLPGGIQDLNVSFLHMNIHASTICLHQAAIVTAQNNGIERSFIAKCQTRSLMAAGEIAAAMRLITHRDISYMNSWMGFCLYVAAGVFIQDIMDNSHRDESRNNLEFILGALRAIGSKHMTTSHFTAQVEFDIENSGINKSKLQTYVIDENSFSSVITESFSPGFTVKLPALRENVFRTRRYPGVIKSWTDASSHDTLDNPKGLPGPTRTEKMTPIYGLQPDASLTNPTTSTPSQIWATAGGVRLGHAGGCPLNTHLQDALRSSPINHQQDESFQETASWNTSENEHMASYFQSLPTSLPTRSPNNDHSHTQSSSEVGITQGSWPLDDTTSVDMCPYMDR